MWIFLSAAVKVCPVNALQHYLAISLAWSSGQTGGRWLSLSSWNSCRKPFREVVWASSLQSKGVHSFVVSLLLIMKELLLFGFIMGSRGNDHARNGWAYSPFHHVLINWSHNFLANWIKGGSLGLVRGTGERPLTAHHWQTHHHHPLWYDDCQYFQL